MSAIPEDLRMRYEHLGDVVHGRKTYRHFSATPQFERGLIERIAALEAQVQTLQKALTGRLPIDELTEVVRAALAATEKKA